MSFTTGQSVPEAVWPKSNSSGFCFITWSRAASTSSRNCGSVRPQATSELGGREQPAGDGAGLRRARGNTAGVQVTM